MKNRKGDKCLQDDFIEVIKKQKFLKGYAFSPCHNEDYYRVDTSTEIDEDDIHDCDDKTYEVNEKVEDHQHGVLHLPSQKTKEQVIDMFSKLSGFTKRLNSKGTGYVIPGLSFMKCNCLPEAVKYLIHQNAPDKAQYNPADIDYKGIHVETYLNYAETIADKRGRLQQIEDIIDDENIVEYHQLTKACRKNPVLYDAFIKESTHFKRQLDSTRHDKENFEKQENYFGRQFRDKYGLTLDEISKLARLVAEKGLTLNEIGSLGRMLAHGSETFLTEIVHQITELYDIGIKPYQLFQLSELIADNRKELAENVLNNYVERERSIQDWLGFGYTIGYTEYGSSRDYNHLDKIKEMTAWGIESWKEFGIFMHGGYFDEFGFCRDLYDYDTELTDDDVNVGEDTMSADENYIMLWEALTNRGFNVEFIPTQLSLTLE
jgi:hypothetical protein